ncbi:hypothetical protein CGRA01v4_03006 [Colletotrichum graminicola]|nr:hypothetical protein CGRA01v4_03006 [Colletotrichum graminicola]
MTLEREEGPRPHSTLLAGILVPHYSLLEAQDPGALAISQRFHHQKSTASTSQHQMVAMQISGAPCTVLETQSRSKSPVTICSRHACIMGHGEGAEFSVRTRSDQETCLTRKTRSRRGALAWFRHQGSSWTQSTVLANGLARGGWGGVCSRGGRRDIRWLQTPPAGFPPTPPSPGCTSVRIPRLLFWRRDTTRVGCVRLCNSPVKTSRPQTQPRRHALLPFVLLALATKSSMTYPQSAERDDKRRAICGLARSNRELMSANLV